MHGDRLSAQRLSNKVGHDHAVSAALPRSDRVEQAHDDDGNAVLLPVRKRHELVKELACCVSPSDRCRGTEHEVGILAERKDGPVSVHLGGRGNEHMFLLSASLAQHRFGSVNVGLDGPDRRSDHEPHAD